MTDKGELISFSDVPDILPLKPLGEWDGLNYDELMATTASEEEQKELAASSTPGPNPHLYNYETQDQAQRDSLLNRFELIRKRKIDMREPDGLPSALIVNCAASGRMEEIEGLFSGQDLQVEIMMCEEDLDPYRKALEIDLTQYSCLIAVGGDGTFNQMVNGML